MTIDTKIESAARTYFKEELKITVGDSIMAINDPMLRCADFKIDEGIIPVVARLLDKRFGPADSFDAQNGTEFAWDFGTKQRVYLIVRMDGSHKIGLVQL